MSNQKVVVICKVNDVKRLYDRSRISSDDKAGKNVFFFNKTQVSFLANKTKFMVGKVHLEGTRYLSNKKITLSTCTYRDIMSFANSYMLKDKHYIYVGPAYSKGQRITDFQTVVTGSVEKEELDSPFDCANREISEEIGIEPTNIELVDTTIYGDLKVFTLVAEF